MGRIDSALISATERLYYVPHRRAHVTDWLVRALHGYPPNGWLLDFGGGHGAVALELTEHLPARIAVADVDRASLSGVPRQSRLRPVLIPSRPPLPFRTRTFAGIVLVDVLHHVPECERTLADLTSLLAPGGVIAVVEFDPHRLATRAFKAFARLGGRRCRFQTRATLSEWLRGAGLHVETETLDSLRYGVRAQRPPDAGTAGGSP